MLGGTGSSPVSPIRLIVGNPVPVRGFFSLSILPTPGVVYMILDKSTHGITFHVIRRLLNELLEHFVSI